MSLGKKLTITILSTIIINSPTARADIPQGPRAIAVSGGEQHTLVLTAMETVWASGANGGSAEFGNYYGVLGIDSDKYYLTEKTLIQVKAGDMNTPSDLLQDIVTIDAGWTHSLALDSNGMVWAWGDNYHGQLGDSSTEPHSTPVKVLSGDQDPNDPNAPLKYIQSISAGRSGEHSLALDANGCVWAWGRTEFKRVLQKILWKMGFFCIFVRSHSSLL